MRNIPIQPRPRLGLAKILNEHYGMPGMKSVLVATDIIKYLRAADMDIVMGDWMASEGEVKKKPELRWEDLAEIARSFEGDPRAPWNAPELK